MSKPAALIGLLMALALCMLVTGCAAPTVQPPLRDFLESTEYTMDETWCYQRGGGDRSLVCPTKRYLLGKDL